MAVVVVHLTMGFPRRRMAFMLWVIPCIGFLVRSENLQGRIANATAAWVCRGLTVTTTTGKR